MKKKNDIDNPTQKYLLYKQFVAWSCNGCSSDPLTGYTNNPVYQELIHENDYNGVWTDEKVYLDLRASAGYTSGEEKLEKKWLQDKPFHPAKKFCNQKTQVKDLGIFVGRVLMCCQGRD